MTQHICPECIQGKHGNCNGQAWDTKADEPTACTCGHSRSGLDPFNEVDASLGPFESRGFIPIKQDTPYSYGSTDPSIERVDHEEREKIRDLLMGRKITKVDDRHLLLDDGTVLKFIDTDGGCACSAGCYDLSVLNGGGVDNIITDVKFDYRPLGDDVTDEQGNYIKYDDPRRADMGFYRIFVFADNQQINLAQWDGDDGNGYYGTGFSILVRRA